jgi:hypothetical protein
MSLRNASRVLDTRALRARLRPIAQIVRSVWAFLRNAPPLGYLIALVLCAYWRARAQAMLGRLRPDVIVLFEDNIGGFTRYIGAAAARRKIPYVVLPTTIPNPREPATFFRRSKAHSASGLIGKFLARRAPEWIYEFDGYRMLRLPSADILAMRVLGVEHAKPWVLNSGQAAAICAESPASRAIYERLGIARQQLALTGSLVDDTLFAMRREREGRRRALETELALPSGRLLVVVAFPPDQFAARWQRDFEYGSFEELVTGWREALAPLAGSVNIVMRPHPRLSPGGLETFVPAGCRVITRPTEEIVPLADVFVASISATIRWALGLGIPAINYDCYRYHYEDYNGAQGMVLVEDRHSFASVLREISLDAAARNRLSAKAMLDRVNWGLMDGGFSKRFLALLQKIARAPEDAVTVVPCRRPL